jgi:hypothetical protein
METSLQTDIPYYICYRFIRTIMDTIASSSKSDNVKLMGLIEADEFYIKAGLKGRAYHGEILNSFIDNTLSISFSHCHRYRYRYGHHLHNNVDFYVKPDFGRFYSLFWFKVQLQVYSSSYLVSKIFFQKILGLLQ